ncbi:hypothetical protein [Streptomyces sp. NPDC093589]|uniref:hypothetical protein n=1 Tax=Streptomyces sp. NPDC093589 TaxID=3366043 RepID=UPI0037FB946F
MRRTTDSRPAPTEPITRRRRGRLLFVLLIAVSFLVGWAAGIVTEPPLGALVAMGAVFCGRFWMDRHR